MRGCKLRIDMPLCLNHNAANTHPPIYSLRSSSQLVLLAVRPELKELRSHHCRRLDIPKYPFLPLPKICRDSSCSVHYDNCQGSLRHHGDCEPQPQGGHRLQSLLGQRRADNFPSRRQHLKTHSRQFGAMGLYLHSSYIIVQQAN